MAFINPRGQGGRLFAATCALLLSGLRPVSHAQNSPPAGELLPPDGYAAQGACTSCHSEIADAYSHTGMARSFFRPSPDTDIEDLSGEPYYHPGIDRYYEFTRTDEGLMFRRYQKMETGGIVNDFRTKIDWILGSGDHARTYLYRTESGELFQIPVAWYTNPDRWAMAPGFEKQDNEGVSRRVRRECMNCHNAYPRVEPGADAYSRPPVFDEHLPQGTGCQRCHGPSAAHISAASRAGATADEIREAVVNPARLSPQLRDDVCDQCHWQPSVAIFGVRRFGRHDYSYKPGEPLDDYMVQVDIKDAELERGDRFEINHHPYRLRQSRCYLESEGQLSCTNCHDPHRNVPEEQRAAHYRQVCAQCHSTDDIAGIHSLIVDPVAESDCTSCHMQKRRTQDVVQVFMTDHKIHRLAGGPEWQGVREEREPPVVGIEIVDRPGAPEGAEAELYRVAALLRSPARPRPSATDYMRGLLVGLQPAHPDPYVDLARTLVKLRNHRGAGDTAEKVLELDPENKLASEWIGLAQYLNERPDLAIETFHKAIAASPKRPEAHYNLGLILYSMERYEEAVDALREAVRLRTNLAAGWLYLGESLTKIGEWDAALEAHYKLLAVDPTHTRGYIALCKTLLATGSRDEAVRWYEHGLRVADSPQQLSRDVAELLGLEPLPM